MGRQTLEIWPRLWQGAVRHEGEGRQAASPFSRGER
jgi:hypothetical protein